MINACNSAKQRSQFTAVHWLVASNKKKYRVQGHNKIDPGGFTKNLLPAFLGKFREKIITAHICIVLAVTDSGQVIGGFHGGELKNRGRFTSTARRNIRLHKQDVEVLAGHAAVVYWLVYSPLTNVNRVRFTVRSSMDFRRWEQCRTMPHSWRVFSGIFRFPRPCIPALLHTHLTLTFSALKASMPKCVPFSHSAETAKTTTKGRAPQFYTVQRTSTIFGREVHQSPTCIQEKEEPTSPVSHPQEFTSVYRKTYIVHEHSSNQELKECIGEVNTRPTFDNPGVAAPGIEQTPELKGWGKREIPEKTRRQYSHVRKSGVTLPGIEPVLPWWEASRELQQRIAKRSISRNPLNRLTIGDMYVLKTSRYKSAQGGIRRLFTFGQRQGKNVEWVCPIAANRSTRTASGDHFNWIEHMNKVMRPLSVLIVHKAEEYTTCIQVDLKQVFKTDSPIIGSIPGRVITVFGVWESCRTMLLVRGFSRGSPVSPPFHSGAAPFSSQSSSSGLNTSIVGVNKATASELVFGRITCSLSFRVFVLFCSFGEKCTRSLLKVSYRRVLDGKTALQFSALRVEAMRVGAHVSVAPSAPALLGHRCAKFHQPGGHINEPLGGCSAEAHCQRPSNTSRGTPPPPPASDDSQDAGAQRKEEENASTRGAVGGRVK
ncbi:hypothetical protein PR048_025401 [Dryococelus australis]|uniref:Uncharacterized protein n=1 Tax=Dryococelus australis TaxID=614101 RepID=A0ABQ9GR88_9NEOP|nr:hypothetical protein PR048_025401 [Dryococelus australis]